jgi:signal transduction histidine kinase
MNKKKTYSTDEGMGITSVRLDPDTAQLIAIFTHELKNPITCLYYLVHHLLNMGSRDKEGLEIYPILRRQVDHLVYLVDTMTDCSWLDCGELSLKTELVEINDLIKQALEMTRPVMDEREKWSIVVYLSRFAQAAIFSMLSCTPSLNTTPSMT